MPNEFLQYDITHLAGILIAIIALVLAGLLIWKFSKKDKDIKVLWIPFLLVISFVFGNKFA